MPFQLKTIATFLTPEDAEVARIALAEEGISASLENANTVGLFWYFGNATGWVKLQVPDLEEQRAREILEKKTGTADFSRGAAVCSKCGACIPAEFDVCWNCGEAIPEVIGEATNAPHGVEPDLDDKMQKSAADEAAWRAFRAAVIGIFVLPPLLTLYSAWLILRLAVGGQWPSATARKYLYSAIVVDVMTCLGIGMLFALQ